MVALNPYLAYKRDTSRLTYWIVKASNAIIASSSALRGDSCETPNTDGRLTVAGFVSLCKLIAKHIDPVSPAILGLFNSVIQARSAQYQAFSSLVSNKSDPELERSNASHKHFIDALTEAFEALGGSAWVEQQRKRSSSAKSGADDQAELEQVLFSNSFASLSLETDPNAEDEGPSDEDEGRGDRPNQAPSTRRRQAKKSGKGKKGKSGKASKKNKQPPAAQTKVLDDVPIESYRIIQDEEGLVTEYLMAVYALVEEWAGVRSYLQRLWRDVAYKGLNSAVAGAVTNVAVNMIERSAAAMFIDYPGHDSYETVMNTITRGDPEKAQGMFSVATHWVSADHASITKLRETAVDVQEQFLIHAYRDLLDFVNDF